MYEPNFNPDGDMLIGELSHVTSDLKIIDPMKARRGVCYIDTKVATGFCENHESLEDLYKTINHEIIHGLIEEERQENDIKIDEDHEHWVIHKIQWADEYLI